MDQGPIIQRPISLGVRELLFFNDRVWKKSVCLSLLDVTVGCKCRVLSTAPHSPILLLGPPETLTATAN